MILPIGDDNTDLRITPLVNYVLIALNVAVFVFFQRLGSDDRFTYAFSTVPAEIRSGKDIHRPVSVRDESGREVGVIQLQPTPLSVYVTLLTSMFMHGGIAHIFGNMLYLWIFGDNLEQALGRAGYLVFYLVSGVIASLSHVFVTYAFHANPLIPSLGASGAIAGVLGGYFLLFPRRRVRVILMRTLTDVPAIVAIGMWFLFQLILGAGALGGSGGVAYGAHIGGFIAGFVLVKPFARVMGPRGGSPS